MKTIRFFLTFAVLVLGSFFGNDIYAQYPPGQQLPVPGGADDYDWSLGKKGFIRVIGNPSPLGDKCMFSIATTELNGERFRVSANGTTSVLGRIGGQPALNFYTANYFYLGSIGFPGEELTISGLYGIRINPNRQNKAFFTTTRTDIFTPLYLPLKGYYANENIGFKMGRNEEPLINSNFNGKRLRIGAKNGIGFWGNGNVEANDTPNLSINADGGVTLSNSVLVKIGRNGDPTIKSDLEKWLRIGSRNGVAFWGNANVDEDNRPHVLIADDRVTIGEFTNPVYKLNVGGNICIENEGVKTLFGRDSDRNDAWIGTVSNHGLYMGANDGSCLYFDAANHNTYIGLVDAEIAEIRQELKDQYKLFVANGVLSEDYGIGPKSSWADFVFNKGYALKTIPQVEAFISENNHLPDVPSAKQVAEEGYSQHDMNKILLQKIEELTLYTIQQQKEIQELKTELSNLKK